MNNINDFEPAAAGAGFTANAMTVDVEEYFQVSAFESHVSRQRWAHFPSRVEASVDRILALFELANVRATFFTLGWVAERFPSMVRAMADAGHEIASHGMDHVRATQQDRATFFADVSRSRAILQDVSGQPVRGYRAASFSVGQDNIWALDALAQAGYTYSSSIYPGRHPAYGMPQAPRFAFRMGDSPLLELPITTLDIGGRRYPCAGGGFFRLYPYHLTRWALQRVNRVDDQPAVFYFHPWEIDPDQPRVPEIGLKTRVRHYLNLHRVEPRLRRLLSDFSWDRMDRVFALNASATHATSQPVAMAEHKGA